MLDVGGFKQLGHVFQKLAVGGADGLIVAAETDVDEVLLDEHPDVVPGERFGA